MTVKAMGDARVLMEDQNLDLQRDALERAGSGRIYADRASGSRADLIVLTRKLWTTSSGKSWADGT